MEHHEFYNKELKERFISQIKDNQVVLPYSDYYEINFSSTKMKEEELQKDLYEWNHEEVIDYYKTRNYKSSNTLSELNGLYARYYDFCLREGYTSNIENVFKTITLEEIRKSSRGHYLIHRDEILKLCKDQSIENVVDSFLLLAIYEGIRGKGYKEFAHLTMDDFIQNEGKWYVRIYDGKKGDESKMRMIPVSNDLYHLAKQSAEEQFFYFSGRRKKFSKSEDVVKLLDEFAERREKNGTPYEYTLNRFIMRRIVFVLDHVSLDDITCGEYLSATDIRKSGMMQYLSDCIARDNVDYKTYFRSKNLKKDMKLKNYYILSVKDVIAQYERFLE